MTAALAAAFGPVAGCGGGSSLATDSPSVRGDPFHVGLGQEHAVAQLGAEVSLLDVLSDDRCARDVQCVRAGSARVRIGVRVNQGPRTTHELSTPDGPTSVRLGGFTVILDSLTPLPIAGQALPMSQYQAFLRITAETKGR